jgi:hypothetical protein
LVRSEGPSSIGNKKCQESVLSPPFPQKPPGCSHTLILESDRDRIGAIVMHGGNIILKSDKGPSITDVYADDVGNRQ